jgi:anti-sigma regulatory factor (Ser/Thr protein kinase)
MTETRHLWHQLHEVDGRARLDLRGELGLGTTTHLRNALGAALMDRGQVVADVSDLAVTWPAALAVFPAALARAGGWPLARLVLLGAGPAFASAMRDGHADRSVPLADTWPRATALLASRPERISRDVPLPATVEAARLARFAAEDTCHDWELDRLSPEAQMIATELVINAVEHARTESTLAFTLTGHRFHIAVRDRAPISAAQFRRLDDPARTGRGRGLVLVDGLARYWGVSPHSNGKIVWAVLDIATTP